MALVKSIIKGKKNKESIHKPTECKYFILNTPNGKFLQLDTYASKDRKILSKTSQSLQFDIEAINELKEIINKYFK